jgi:WD40 repeat protein
MVRTSVLTIERRAVNGIAWAPQECGAVLACASSDGNVSTVSLGADGQWQSSAPFSAHAIGCNAVSWAPAAGGAAGTTPPKRIATGGCDNLVKIWRCVLTLTHAQAQSSNKGPYDQPGAMFVCVCVGVCGCGWGGGEGQVPR